MENRQEQRLDQRISTALGKLRRQLRLRTGLETILLGIAIVLGAFWLGFLVDRGPTFMGGREMPRSARLLFLVVVVVGTVHLVVKGFRQGALRPLSAESLALLLERKFRQLDGKLLTAVQLVDPTMQSGRQPRELDYAPALLERVHRQAAEEVAKVRPEDALRWQPVGLMASFAGPLTLATLLLVLLAPGVARQAWGRLLLVNDDPWPRRAMLEVIGLETPLTTFEEAGGPRETRLIEFRNGVVRVGRGEAAALRVRARADQWLVPEVCTVYYRTSSGLRGQANMRRVGRVAEGWQVFSLDGPPLDAITENIRFEVRGLDARLDDLRIEAIEPPVVQKLDLVVTPPPYLIQSGSTQSVRPFQPGVRVPEGSQVVIRGAVTSVMQEVLAQKQVVGENEPPQQEQPILVDGGKQFEWSLGPVFKPLTCRVIPIDQQYVRSSAAYRYLISVAPDLPPEVKLRLKGISDAVTPNALLPAQGQAVDDYGIVQPQLLLSVGTKEAPLTNTITRPLGLGREGEYGDQIDLAAMQSAGTLSEIKPGMVLTVLAEAQDAYDLGTAHVGRSDRVTLEVVTPDEMLARLERQELALRSRLQEVIREVQQLRELIDQVRREGWTTTTPESATAMVQDKASGDDDPDAPESPTVDRTRQLMILRSRQASLQTSKSTEELRGIYEGIGAILEELANNRLDSPDRRDRLVGRVQTPLQSVVEREMVTLDQQVDLLPKALDNPAGQASAASALAACEQVLLRLDEILRGMLELEGYNELLDLVRDLIDDQGNLIKDTEKEQKKRVWTSFNDERSPDRPADHSA